MRVALLGTGIMGSGMARNLADAGHDVHAWNRTREKAEALTDAGVTVADTPAAAAEEADVLVTMLFDTAATRDATTGPDGAFAAASGPRTWVQSATVGDGYEELAELARAAGVTYLDAPVLGTRGPAEAGQLVTLIAGDPAGRDAAREVVEAWSAAVVELGDEPGAASRTKLLVNTWLGVLNGGLAELLALAPRLGVAPSRLLELLEGGGLWAPVMGAKGPAMVTDDEEVHFPLVGLRKDVGMALEAGGVGDDELPTLRAVREALDAALDAGLGDRDIAALHRVHAADG